jgi:hypothetical protein
VLRAAERGVQQQRPRSGIEADHRRDAGDRGVGEGFGDENGPDGQAGDEVTVEPGALVAAK